MTDSDDKKPLSEAERILKSIRGNIPTMDNLGIPDLDDSPVFTPFDPDPRFFAPNLSDSLPKYFWLTTEELKSLSNDDLYNLLQDEFFSLEQSKIKVKIHNLYLEYQLHNQSKDTAKEILADRRTENLKPKAKHWIRKSIEWFAIGVISAIIATLVSAYNPEIRNFVDCTLGLEGCESSGDDQQIENKAKENINQQPMPKGRK